MMFIIPDKLLAMFDASDNMIKIGVPALKIISTSYIFAGFNIAACSVFQALSNGMYSLIVSAARQIVVLVPVAFALATTGVLEYVWLSYPIAEIASLIISSLMLKKTMKRLNF